MTLHIAIVGASDATPDEASAAKLVGQLVAQAGAFVVCGGLGGVMEAACAGVRTAGGTSIGFLPGLDRSAANRHVSIAIPTGLGEARNALIIRAADAVIAIGGGYGTLSEIALALRAQLAVIGLGTWQITRAGVVDTAITQAASPHQAAGLALAAARQR